MRDPVVVKCGDTLIPLHRIEHVDISRVEQHEVRIHVMGDYVYIATGFDAIEAVMLLKPSAFEGRRMRWQRNAWAFHNFIAHPVVQILAWLGLKRQAIAFHDWTTPRPRGQ